MDRFIERDGERRASRMREVIERLGVDRSALAREGGGSDLLRAQEKCQVCPCVAECLMWVDGRATAETAPAFCCNLALFERCRGRHD